MAALRCFCLLDPKFKCFVTTLILVGLMDINLMWPSKEVLKITQKEGRNPAHVFVHFLLVHWAGARGSEQPAGPHQDNDFHALGFACSFSLFSNGKVT